MTGLANMLPQNLRMARMTANLAAIGLLCVTAVPIAIAQDVSQDRLTSVLTNLLEAQKTAWNRGDLEGFMDAYWKSDQLAFSSGGRTTRGWQATLDRYKKKYQSTGQMGHLEFSSLEVTGLGDAAAMMLGRWQLTENDHPAGGNFTLIWRKFGDQWKIIHDHTSVLDTADSGAEQKKDEP